ncbi:phage holin family protein [Cellulomonas persica]|uniref:Membrane protein n=1 Tax=Cellulomonas persica TaxID=76861 RepID=A0A510URW8_9CELL|nr:phage holin family protein [Cellulomonas persica]GEK17339.1 membrane protein [Cellulomonas persica]
MTTNAQPQRSLGQLVSDLSEQTSRLVRAEIELAKTEIAERAKILGAGSGMLVAAGVLALYLLAAVLTTLVIVLDLWLPLWAAALIVTLLLLIVVVVLALLGVKALKKASPPAPQAAIASVQDDVAALKGPSA